MKEIVYNLLYTLILIPFLSISLFGSSIEVGGHITANTTWNVDTVKVIDTIFIDSGVMVQISPGTYVESQSEYYINVMGTLHAEGTVDDSICFTGVVKWAGIMFNDIASNNDSSIMSFCRVHNAGIKMENNYGAIDIKNSSKIRINNCLISYNVVYQGVSNGIYCFNSDPLIKENIISNNGDSYENSYGISCNGSNPMIIGNTISNNGSDSEAGGIDLLNSNPVIKENIIMHHDGDLHSCYGIRLNYSSPLIINNLIKDIGCSGGVSRRAYGIYCSHSHPKIINNVISDNKHYSAEVGGIVCNDGSNPDIINNTISNNINMFGVKKGIGISFSPNSSPRIINTIVWGNSDEQIMSDSLNDKVKFCAVEGGYPGEGNIDIYPEFTDSANGDFSITNNSPCINAGSPDTAGLNLPTTDITGNQRIYGGRIDIGAYENQQVVKIEDQQSNNYSLSQFKVKLKKSLNQVIIISLSKNISVEIYDLKGKFIRKLSSTNDNPYYSEITWDTRDHFRNPVPSGQYFIRVKSSENESVKSFVIVK